jgi:septal ring factor EnvC (AmiA/AmiB activator)
MMRAVPPLPAAMPLRVFILRFLILPALAGLVSCDRPAPEVDRRPLATLQAEVALARSRLADSQRQVAEMQARLGRAEAELEEANRRLARVKVENAKLRQELNAWRKKNGT